MTLKKYYNYVGTNILPISPVSVTENMQCRKRDQLISLQQGCKLFLVAQASRDKPSNQNTKPVQSSSILMIIVATSKSHTWSWHLVFPSVEGDSSKLPGKLPERMRIFRHRELRSVPLPWECRWSAQRSFGSLDHSQSPREHQRSEKALRTTIRTGPG